MAEYRFSFSYSRWSLWSKCPAAYKYQNIDKVPVETSPALIKGRKVHNEIAKYLMGAADDMPASLKHFTNTGAQLREARAAAPKTVHVELQYAVDRDIRPVTWFSKNAWCRMAWDVLVETTPQTVDAVDWKTGKPYASYEDQKQLFALGAFWRNPSLETFTGHWLYLDHPDEPPHTATFDRDQAVRLTEVWKGNAAIMEADRVFPAKPSESACRFCDFSWRKNGPCKEGV